MTLVDGYLDAVKLVQGAGFNDDILWAARLQDVRPTPKYVVQEGAWVIVNSGFRYAVARKLWPRIGEAFHWFEPELVGPECADRAMAILRHRGKLNAVVTLAANVAEYGIGPILEDARDPPRLTRFPFIGPTTCWHFAKVLGVDCVKPDVHLRRAAAAAGFATPLEMCQAIRDATGDRLTVVDSVLWRYGEQRERRGWRGWKELFS